MHGMHDPTPAPVTQATPHGEHLTPEQHEALQPLMRLAALGTPTLTQQLKRLTPGEISRQQLKRRAIDALKEHGTLKAAAAAADVAPSTIYRWRDNDPQFAAEVDEFLHVTMVEELEASMYRIATSTDPKMANAAVRAGELLLKAENRDKYGDHQKIESTQTVNHLVQVVHTVRDGIKARQHEALQRLKTIDAEPTPPTP